ncbi:MAG: winged helix-turn-helix transcriptional regulator [Telluria sp.]
MSHPHVDLFLAFQRSYARLRLQLDDELGTYHGIDLDDLGLLHALAGAGGAATGLAALATTLGISRSALLRRLRPLEKTGVVASTGGVADRCIALRPPSRVLLAAARDTVARVCERPAFRVDAAACHAALFSSLEPSQP